MGKGKLGSFQAVLVLVMMLALIAAGCSNGNNGDTGTSGSAAENKDNATAGSESGAAADDEPVELRLLTRWSGTDSNAPIWKAAQEEYTKMHPNVKFIDESVNEEAAYNSKFKTDLATGNLPAIFGVNGKLLAVEYAKTGLLMDFGQAFRDDPEWLASLNESAVNEMKFDGYGVSGYYGIPVATAIEVFFYNKELFEKAGIAGPPETYAQLLEAIDKLKAAGTIPWGVGAKDTWRAGHVHNAHLYKLAGVQKAIDIGQRKAKWTDPEVVKSLQMVLDLKNRGAFEQNFEGIDYEMEKTNFLTGKYGMIYNGTWFIADAANSDMKDKVGMFLFPTMEEHPEYAGDNVAFPQTIQASAKLSDAQKKHVVGFLKMYTSKEFQERMAYETKNLPVNVNVELDKAQTGDLFFAANNLTAQVKVPGQDTFGYDPLASMQDRSRNSIIGMLLGNSPEEAAKEIQDEIDKNS